MSNVSKNMRKKTVRHKHRDQKPFKSLKLTQSLNFQKYQRISKTQKHENMRIAPKTS